MAPLSHIYVRDTSSDGDCPNSISGGGIAGIVIGSIAGTLLLLWLWKLCMLPGAWGGDPDYGYSSSGSGGYETRRRHRRRRSPSYYEYVEKPSVRRPAKVYLS